MNRAHRLLLPCSLALLAACSTQPKPSVSVEEKQLGRCPMQLHSGQTLTVTLPSNPTTGFRWVVEDAASGVLRSLGQEVYTTPEDAGVVGAAGVVFSMDCSLTDAAAAAMPPARNASGSDA